MRIVPKVSGFTIIELVVTVAIVAILASAVLPMAELNLKREKEYELRRALREIREALDAYKRAGEDGHFLRKAGESGYPAKLEDLVTGVVDATDPQGRKMHFLRRIPRDPLYPDQNAPAEQSWGKRSYASSADDPREGDDVFDVYSLAPGAGINGVPYREW